jgi:hypothetical protein
MDVYLVPVGAERYELYCEVPDHAEAEQLDGPEAEEQRRAGFIRRMRRRFREMLAEAERERRHAGTVSEEGREHGWLSRVRTRTLRWVAESIAEQRLLWHLRRETETCLFYPDDMEEAQPLAILRAQLGRDFDKHRFWLVIDALGFVGSGLLMLIPGPNLIAYYFAFRLVGHYLSLRGARQGLSVIEWRLQKSAPLSELRRAVALEPEVRGRRVREVAARLRLEHLASFFERTAIPG